MLGRIAHSLPARILGVFLATSLVYAWLSRLAVELVLDTDYLREIVGAHMSLHADYVLKDLGSPPDIERAQRIVAEIPVDIRIEGPDVSWASDPSFQPLAELPFEASELLEFRARGRDNPPAWMQQLDSIEFARYRRHSYVKLDTGDYSIAFVSPKIAVMPPPNLTWLILGLVSVFVLAGCYFTVRWLVKPIQWIKQGAARIGAGDLEYRIPKARQDDLGDLATDINRMAEQVREMLEAKRQLLLAISHELRSPLTRTKVAIEFLDDETTRRAILEDVEEMEQLINELLEGERLGTRHEKLHLTPTDPEALLEQLVAEDFADEADRVRVEVGAGVGTMELDATRVRLMLKNLVGNALRHTPPGRPPVEVHMDNAPRGLSIRVVDHGDGIPPEHLPHVTEPFYRADPARSRATGGFGLGLHLCRRIVEAHEGEFDIMSKVGEGTVVAVLLPREVAAHRAA